MADDDVAFLNASSDFSNSFDASELFLLEASNDLVLPEVSLCMIVREEIMNPAGGIELFLKSHSPFFEEMVVVDTGSKDGTRECLEDALPKFSNLKVFDRKWNGYSDARMFSIKKADSRFALILDADELLEPEDFRQLKAIFWKDNKLPRKSVFEFEFRHINPEKDGHSSYWNERMFRISKFRRFYSHFTSSVFENITFDDEAGHKQLDIAIKHFLPSEAALALKQQDWYDTEDILIKSPRDVASFKQWKEFNPRRKEFYPFVSRNH